MEKLDFVVAVGRNIRVAREMRGVRQEDLAKKCDLSVSSIAKIERGEAFPRQDTLNTISEALSVPVGKLLQVSETPVVVEPFQDREFIKQALALFQYRLEPGNFIRKDPTTIMQYVATRDEAETEAWLAAMLLRLAELRGYEFINDPRARELAVSQLMDFLAATKSFASPAGLFAKAEKYYKSQKPDSKKVLKLNR